MTQDPTPLFDQAGGPDGPRPLLTTSHDHAFDAVLSGYLFWNADKARLIDKEVEFAARRWLIDRGRDRAGGDVCRRDGAALEQREVARRCDRYAALSPGIERGDGSRGRRAVGLQSAARRDTGICTKPYGLDRSGGALSLPAIEREREWGRLRARWRW